MFPEQLLRTPREANTVQKFLVPVQTRWLNRDCRVLVPTAHRLAFCPIIGARARFETRQIAWAIPGYGQRLALRLPRLTPQLAGIASSRSLHPLLPHLHVLPNMESGVCVLDSPEKSPAQERSKLDT